ncbi:ribosomal protein S27E [Pseudomonas koreensis]|nr:ribosomal protein S27E [Pseudomonas koreensis]
MCRRFREQARSHKDSRSNDEGWLDAENCGSELARESGGSVEGDVECADAFASKPAPTRIRVRMVKGWLDAENCGSELARESGGSVERDVECADAFASKPAPTRDSRSNDEGWLDAENCGSELARERGGSVEGDVECADAFASKPAPTRDSRSNEGEGGWTLPQGICGRLEIACRRWLKAHRRAL